MAKVSICVPTYNAGAYLEPALRSALEQTCRDVEVLVVDNCSTDETESIVSRLARSDDRIRFVRNPVNLGMVANFNRCLELAAAPYIKFLCADDVLAPECVEVLVQELQAHPEVSLVTCARAQIDPRGEALGTVRYAAGREQIPGHAARRHCFYHRNIVGEPTAVLFRKEHAARGFDPGFAHSFDVELWLHLLERGDLVLLPQALCSIRLHPDQASATNLRSDRVVEDKRRMFRRFTASARVEASVLERTLWDLRMASSVARTGPQMVRELAARALDEVHFPALFKSLMVPVVAWLYGLRNKYLS